MPRTAPPGLTSALSHASADKRVEILRRVGASGSISQAARDVGVSYKAAWQAIDTLSNLAGVALVQRAVGGAGGGGARLTPAAHQLLAAADALAQARQQVLRQWRQGAAATGVAPALGQLSVRTSMRNQLPCTVVALDGRGTIVQARLSLADGTVLVSRLTRESAELLGLQPGLPVLVLCKATAVLVSRAPRGGVASPAPNTLPGRATRVARGDVGDEVCAELSGGLQLVGFAPPSSGLRAGSPVLLSVDASALVLALA